MADNMRWRYGDTNPVVVWVIDTTVIEIGDLLYLELASARPANLDTNGDGTADNWQGSLLYTQWDFHSKFLGVAMQRSRAGEAGLIRVATTGVFEFDAESATYGIGELVGPAQDGTDDRLLNQHVMSVGEGGEDAAIGRVAKGVTGASVLVDVISTIMAGGTQRPVSSSVE